MISRTKSMFILAMLASHRLCAYELTLKSLKSQAANVASAMKKHQYVIAGGLASAAVVSYLVYAFYLDKELVADKGSWWYWALTNINESTVDKEELLMYSQERHPELLAVHPLSVVFAADHEVRDEIDRCVTLRSMLQALSTFNLDWLYHETLVRLDKKLEALYTLKTAITACTTEVRSRCKKQALCQLTECF